MGIAILSLSGLISTIDLAMISYKKKESTKRFVENMKDEGYKVNNENINKIFEIDSTKKAIRIEKIMSLIPLINFVILIDNTDYLNRQIKNNIFNIYRYIEHYEDKEELEEFNVIEKQVENKPKQYEKTTQYPFSIKSDDKQKVLTLKK